MITKIKDDLLEQLGTPRDGFEITLFETIEKAEEMSENTNEYYAFGSIATLKSVIECYREAKEEGII